MNEEDKLKILNIIEKEFFDRYNLNSKLDSHGIIEVRQILDNIIEKILERK